MLVLSQTYIKKSKVKPTHYSHYNTYSESQGQRAMSAPSSRYQDVMQKVSKYSENKRVKKETKRKYVVARPP